MNCAVEFPILLSFNALVITDTELKLIAAAAMMGEPVKAVAPHFVPRAEFMRQRIGRRHFRQVRVKGKEIQPHNSNKTSPTRTRQSDFHRQNHDRHHATPRQLP